MAARYPVVGGLVAAAVVAVVILVALVRGGGSPAGSAPPSAAPPGGPSSAAVSREPTSPLTGRATDPGGPALAVKIDNQRAARPQTGVAAADLVVVAPVEGGITRFTAVFQSDLPPKVGPVRSIRRTDLQLLANLGRPALAFSGEAPELRPRIDAAPIVDVSKSERPGAYFREPDRPVPHNLYARTEPLLAGQPPGDVGFRFGPVPAGGESRSSATVDYTRTEVGIRWDPDERRWLFRMDGAALRAADGDRPAAATVVLQRVFVVATAIRDARGVASPFAKTVGSGSAQVLRDGRAFDVRWSRPTAEDPTVFRRPNGSRMTFARGPVWVVLVPREGAN